MLCRLIFPSGTTARLTSLTIFLRRHFNNRVRINGIDGIRVFVFETFSLVRLFVSLSAVLVAPPDPACVFQCRSLKQARHEGQTLTADVGLPGECVQDRVYAAADEGHGGGERSQIRPDFLQSVGGIPVGVLMLL